MNAQRDLFGGEMLTDAEISDCGRYRYRLRRAWAPGAKILWIMLNPSTADAETDDATIRRCVGFSKRFGAGSLEVVNLFALRATKPVELARARDPVGQRNAAELLMSVQMDKPPLHRIVAWGAGGGRQLVEREAEFWRLFGHIPLWCLGTTAAGHPRHPLRLAAMTHLERYHGPKGKT